MFPKITIGIIPKAIILGIEFLYSDFYFLFLFFLVM